MLLIWILTACPRTEQESPRAQPLPKLSLAEKRSISLVLRDPEGQPIPHATLHYGKQSARSDAMGQATLWDPPMGTLLLQIGAEGYADQLREIQIREELSTLSFETSLVPMQISEGHQGDQPAEIRSADGSFILQIPANSLISLEDKDNPESGPWNEHYSVAWATFEGHRGVPMPGPMLSIPVEYLEEDALDTYGSFQMEVQGHDGQPLQLRDGATATVSLAVPLPEEGEAGLPEDGVVPLWTLDPTLGRWQPSDIHGQAVVGESGEDRLQAELPHFSPPLNFDLRASQECAKIQVEGIGAAQRAGMELELRAPGYVLRQGAGEDNEWELLGLPASRRIPDQFTASLYLYGGLVDQQHYSTSRLRGGRCGATAVTLRPDARARVVGGGDRSVILRIREGDCPAGPVRVQVDGQPLPGLAGPTLWLNNLSAAPHEIEIFREDGSLLSSQTVDCTSICTQQNPAQITLEAENLALPGACTPLPCVGDECDSCVEIQSRPGEIQLDGSPIEMESDGSICIDQPRKADDQVRLLLEGGWSPTLATLPRQKSCAMGGCAEVVLSDNSACLSGRPAPVNLIRRKRLDPAAHTLSSAPWPVPRSRLVLTATGNTLSEGAEPVARLFEGLGHNSATSASFGREGTEINLAWALPKSADSLVIRLPPTSGGLELAMEGYHIGRQSLSDETTFTLRFDENGIWDEGYVQEFVGILGTVQIDELSSRLIAGRLNLWVCERSEARACAHPVRIAGSFSVPFYTAANTPAQLAYLETEPLEGHLVQGIGLYGPTNKEGVTTACVAADQSLQVPTQPDVLPGIGLPGATQLVVWERSVVEQIYANLALNNQNLDRRVTILGQREEGEEVTLSRCNGGRVHFLDDLLDDRIGPVSSRKTFAATNLSPGCTLTRGNQSYTVPATSGGVMDLMSENTAYYADNDGDGYGDPNTTVWLPAPEPGYVADNRDCDDGNLEINPGTTELCDGVDNDCDNRIDQGVLDQWYMDGDGDGFGDSSTPIPGCPLAAYYLGYVAEGGDCDDGNSSINPDIEERCNGRDDNCDGEVDESTAADATTWYLDEDQDGYGAATAMTSACTQPSGFVADYLDCDDTSVNVSPGSTELCNGLDDNCSGSIDEDNAADAPQWYLDADGDSYGDAHSVRSACSRPSGYISDNLDCDDTSADVSPTGTERCDGIDNDCSGTTDEDSADDAPTWYADGDRDGYGDIFTTTRACTAPGGYVADDTDCDDADSAASPGAAEFCGGGDEDCDGVVDEDDAEDAGLWYDDGDGDGVGGGNPVVACSAPTGWMSDGSDCDDGDSSRWLEGEVLSFTGISGFCENYCVRNIAATLDLSGEVTTQGLECVHTIAGHLVIGETVADLTGLQSLESIFGGIQLVNNGVISSLHLPSLTSSAGISVARCSQLLTIELPALKIASGTIFFQQNTLLQQVDLRSLSTSYSVQIEDNQQLNSILLTSYTESTAHFSMFESDNLINLDLPSLRSLGMDLHVRGCDALQTVTVPELRTVGRTFELGTNFNLTTLDTTNLESVGGSMNVHETGLVSLSTPSLDNVGGWLQVYNNPDLLLVDGPALSQVGVNLRILDNRSIQQVELPNLTTLIGYLETDNNDSLADISGIAAIDTIGADLVITDNNSLQQISGLGALTTVGGDLNISSNTSLPTATTTTFANRLSIGGTTTITGNAP